MNDQNTDDEGKDLARIIAIIILVIGLSAAYWVWPSGITELTLASMKFGALLRAIASGLIVIVFSVISAKVWMRDF
jgi:hypothetical protein